MKKTTLILASLVITSICFAQLNYTIPMDSTSTWRSWTAAVYKSKMDGFAQEHEWSDFIVYGAGETTINNLVYTIMLKTGKWTYIDANGHETTGTFKGAPYGHVRSDSTRTYWLIKNLQNVYVEYLLYDFSLQVGDHLPQTLISHSTTYVSFIDTIIINGKSLRRFYINDTVNSNLASHWYIEGIGHELGIIAPMYESYVKGYGLDCYAENGVAVLPPGSNCDLTLATNNPENKNDVLFIYPNPSKGLFTLTYSSNITKEVEIQIRGARGEVITSTKWTVQPGQNERTFNLTSLSPGLYVVLIRDGGGVVNRKFVVQP